MKKLIPFLFLAQICFAQNWDSTQTTDTPNQGRVKFNRGIKEFMFGKKVDTTGLASLTNPVFVLRGDTTWIVKEGANISGSIQVYNVKNAPFNATGDGSTDDRAAIQKAIDSASVSGGTVYFPKGTYKLSTFIDTAYATPDTIASPVGYPSTFTTSDVHLKDTTGNVRFVGDGYGSSIITTASPSIVLLLAESSKDSLLKGSHVEGLTFQYTGGYYGGRHGGSYGIYLKGYGSQVVNCQFKNFLNSVIVGRGSKDCVVERNIGECEHGRASVGYPLYPSRDTGDVYWAHPAVFIRNYGYRTKIAYNTFDGLTNTDFSSETCPDSMKTQMDGLLHGSGTGWIVIGNSVTHFCQEGYYIEEGQSPVSDALTTIVGNLADGYIGTMTGAARLALGTRKEWGRWGIRSDSWNATIAGNTVRNINTAGIIVGYQTSHPENVSITGNVISNASKGIRIDSAKYVTISGNTIYGIVPTQTQKDSGLFFERGIDVYRSSKVNINGNSVYGNHSAWYLKRDTATVQSDSGTATRIYMASTTGLAVGDWIYAHYSPTEPDGGEQYYIDSVGTSYVRANDTVYKTIAVGDTLHFVKSGVDQYGNAGVLLNESDTCQVVSNAFVDCANPIYGMGTTHVGGANTFLNCVKDPTGGLPIRFSLIGGATPISTSGTITTTAQLSAATILLNSNWPNIANDSGAIYIRPHTGQLAMYDGSRAHYQFDIYNVDGQRISLRSDDSSFIWGHLGVGTAWPDSFLTANGMHSLGGLKVDGNVTIVGTLSASSISGDTSAVWGTIQGTLSSQTDLNAALAAKLDSADSTSQRNYSNSLYEAKATSRTLMGIGLADSMATSDTIAIGWCMPGATIDSIIYSGGRTVSLTARLELVDSLFQTSGATLLDTSTCTTQIKKRTSAVAGGSFTLTAGKLVRLVFPAVTTEPKYFDVSIIGHR